MKFSNTWIWDGDYEDVARRALKDVALWLGFADVDAYNKWCENCAPGEFEARLKDAG